MFGFQVLEIEDSNNLMKGCKLEIPSFDTQLDLNQRIKNLENALEKSNYF
jgi:hypothetical protein